MGLKMTKNQTKVFQFKIKLCGIKPMIWRRVQVLSDDTFEDFHHTLQNAMGWYNSHLHEFTVFNPSTGEKERLGHYFDDEEGPEVEDESTKTLDQYFSMGNKKAHYLYDFGDDWEHEIVLEKILEEDKNQEYPHCLAGERACPPEDCGGIWGYEHLLEVIANPMHKEHVSMKEWCGDFNPEKFDALKVRFSS
jgi:hypothetical protein